MEIRKVKASESKELMVFINDYWKKNHILATNKELLDWQFLNGDTYNFVVGVAYGKFAALLGFIPKRHFDPEEKNEIWGSIWCKSPETPKGLGTRLWKWIEDTYKPDIISGIGMNDGIVSLYKKMGFKTSILNHWCFSGFGKLAKYKQQKAKIYYNGKTDEYYLNRYQNHPFYTYHYDNGIIYRVVKANQFKCIIIVDMTKDVNINAYDLEVMLYRHKAEHISCLNYGLPHRTFLNMGFNLKPAKVALPLWFEPLSYDCKRIKFAYKGNGNFVVFKGDSDQDRPNVIK